MLLESGIHALWWAKQTAQASAAAAAQRGKVVGGTYDVNRADGGEAWSDLTPEGGDTDWVDGVGGGGAVAIEATPLELANLLWAMEGGETTSAVAGPPAKTKHLTKPLPGLGHWLTLFTRRGTSQIVRQRHVDSMITQLVIEGSTANKGVRVTPTFITLQPGHNWDTTPTPNLPTKIPFLYTDGTGLFTIDGVAFEGQTQFTLTIDKARQAVQGDAIQSYDIGLGRPTVTLGVTVWLDADGVAQYNKLVYGTATPANATPPLERLPAMGSYSCWLKAKDTAGALNGDEFKLTLAGVKWTVPDLPPFNPGGGPAELAIAGAARKVAAFDLWSIEVNNDSPAFT